MKMHPGCCNHRVGGVVGDNDSDGDGGCVENDSCCDIHFDAVVQVVYEQADIYEQHRPL